MITLYHCLSARSFRPLWTLEELGLEYKLKILPFPPRVSSPEFLEKNPLGTIPLLINGSTVLTESSAMIQYLCSLSTPNNIQVEPNEVGYGEYLNYLHFGEATLTFPQTLILRYTKFEPNPVIASDYTRWFLSRIKNLESYLVENQYLCAGRFTGADISVGYAIMLAEQLGLLDNIKPATQEYWFNLQKRPAFKKSIEAQTKAAINQGISTTLSMHV